MTDQLTGTRLGAYEIRDLLGSGGMGSVYRAFDPALEREVAIKVIGGAALLPDAMTRFRREARLVAALRHPNIVHVYALGEADGRLFMVQELLPGPTLAEQLRRLRKPLPPTKVRAIVGQLASALDYAHAQGVVHRDVKPANALYNAGGGLVLTDFGLARDDEQQPGATGSGVVMGTPSYVAPEQAVGSQGVTKASDIYALGVVLFELLTGRPPFVADTPMGVILKHLYEEPPPPSSLRPDLAPVVDAVVLRALRKEAGARFPSAGALAAALDAALPNEPRPRPELRQGPAESPPQPPTNGKTKAPKPATTTPAKPRAPTRPRAAEDAPIRPATTQAPARNPAPKAAAAAEKPPTSQKALAASAPARRAQRSVVAPVPAQPAERRRSPQLLVGLLTACTVGALLLYGFGVDQATLLRGWAALLQLLGN